MPMQIRLYRFAYLICTAYNGKIRHLGKHNCTDISMSWLNRCWWRILETKCFGDNFETIVTVLVVFVTNVFYVSTLASREPTSKRCHRHRNTVTNTQKWSPIEIYMLRISESLRRINVSWRWIAKTLIKPLFYRFYKKVLVFH